MSYYVDEVASELAFQKRLANLARAKELEKSKAVEDKSHAVKIVNRERREYA